MPGIGGTCTTFESCRDPEENVVAFRTLKVWTKSHQLTLACYGATRSFPKSEMYGLTSQTRRAAASICANIAEGCGRRSKADFGPFLQVALGSASELEYHLLLALDLGLMDESTHRSLDAAVVEVKRMLTGFIRKLTSDV
jgi:four helix bundle protein